VQFNDVPVEWWCKERVGASDEEKKFLIGVVTVDRNTLGSRSAPSLWRSLKFGPLVLTRPLMLP
jgi:hypothetical protein